MTILHTVFLLLLLQAALPTAHLSAVVAGASTEVVTGVVADTCTLLQGVASSDSRSNTGSSSSSSSMIMALGLAII